MVFRNVLVERSTSHGKILNMKWHQWLCTTSVTIVMRRKTSIHMLETERSLNPRVPGNSDIFIEKRDELKAIN